MSLFRAQKQDCLPFDKESVKKEILEKYPLDLPEWKIIRFPQELMSNLSVFPDFLGIRSIEVDKEIKITANPFSHYKRIEPSTYQIVTIIFISDNLTEDGISIDYYIQCHDNWRIIIANSYDMLVRKLNVEE